GIVLRLLGVESASELAMIAGSVGLACNLGALYIMVTEGIGSIQALAKSDKPRGLRIIHEPSEAGQG
ncbi:hypothetical protein IH574_02415, partial [Candidatus Bathyarchaeota archaeon]|nr:hypothetical protein [Candidatus Bathyarchaeota archaeon]